MTGLSNRFSNLSAILTSVISGKGIKNMKYPEPWDSCALEAGHHGMLVAFCAFVRYRAAQSLPIGDNWLSITRERIRLFHISRRRHDLW
jgi:hypothetical protein